MVNCTSDKRCLDFQQGEFIYFNKPYGMSSFGALAFVRTRISQRVDVKRVKPDMPELSILLPQVF